VRDRISQLLEKRRYRDAGALHVVPKSLERARRSGEKRPLHPLWNRRMATKFNGVSYIVQRAAEALYRTEGRRRSPRSSSIIWGTRRSCGRQSRRRLAGWGGRQCAYIWVRAPQGNDELGGLDRNAGGGECRDHARQRLGSAGEGYFRISAFNSRATRRKSPPAWCDAVVAATTPFLLSSSSAAELSNPDIAPEDLQDQHNVRERESRQPPRKAESRRRSEE
jgi:hypothetical protein